MCLVYISINRECYTYRSYFEERALVCVLGGHAHERERQSEREAFWKVYSFLNLIP
jgi:hypothetical protein